MNMVYLFENDPHAHKMVVSGVKEDHGGRPRSAPSRTTRSVCINNGSLYMRRNKGI